MMRSKLSIHTQNILATTASLWDISYERIQVLQGATGTEAKTEETPLSDGDAAD